MMEFKKAPFGTASAVLAHESATPAVSEPDGSLDLGRDVPRTRDLVAALTWTIGGSDLLLG